MVLNIQKAIAVDEYIQQHVIIIQVFFLFSKNQ